MTTYINRENKMSFLRLIKLLTRMATPHNSCRNKQFDVNAIRYGCRETILRHALLNSRNFEWGEILIKLPREFRQCTAWS